MHFYISHPFILLVFHLTLYGKIPEVNMVISVTQYSVYISGKAFCQKIHNKYNLKSLKDVRST